MKSVVKPDGDVTPLKMNETITITFDQRQVSIDIDLFASIHTLQHIENKILNLIELTIEYLKQLD